MGACGARVVSNGPRGDLLTPVPFRGLKSSRARSSCCSRVLRGMGACGARFVSKRAPRRPSHACTLSRVEIIPSQELVPLEGSAWHGCLRCPLCFKRAPRRPSHACTLSRVEIIPSQELVPLEGSPYLLGNRAIKCSTAEAVISRRGRAFLGVAAVCRSRVLRGMGACGARFVSNGPRGDLLTPVPFRGLKSSRARSSCRSRVLLTL
jgi:hypothetical protein